MKVFKRKTLTITKKKEEIDCNEDAPFEDLDDYIAENYSWPTLAFGHSNYTIAGAAKDGVIEGEEEKEKIKSFARTIFDNFIICSVGEILLCLLCMSVIYLAYYFANFI